jgi:hypothetical protein
MANHQNFQLISPVAMIQLHFGLKVSGECHLPKHLHLGADEKPTKLNQVKRNCSTFTATNETFVQQSHMHVSDFFLSQASQGH